ncbi:hypothetical protein GQ457_08G009000 [Hibiscus cannabinus]
MQIASLGKARRQGGSTQILHFWCRVLIPYQWYRYPIPTLESGYRYLLERVSVPLVMHQVSIPELGYRYPYIFTRYRYQGRGIGTQAPHWDLSIGTGSRVPIPAA